MDSNVRDIVGVLDVMCPMHVVVNPTGHISHVGPTLEKLWGKATPVGQRFLEVLEVVRPKGIESISDLWATHGGKLYLRKRQAPHTSLKGVLMPCAPLDGAIINLSFGISIMEGVRDYALSGTDFAATDLTIEMLYLIEAKSAAMEASRKLNLRLQGAKIAAEEQAFTDTLTGLKNRRAVDHILPRLIEKGTRFALMQVDLDFFKAVNDTFGHAAGDQVLQHVARALVEETRSDDCVARIGGDEFVLVFTGLADRKHLGDLAQRLIARIEKPVPFNGDMCKVSCSIGIVLTEDFEDTSLDAGVLLASADAALYASKRAGRAQYLFAKNPENAGPGGMSGSTGDGAVLPPSAASRPVSGSGLSG